MRRKRYRARRRWTFAAALAFARTYPTSRGVGRLMAWALRRKAFT